MADQVKITLVKSPIGSKAYQKATLKALGLTKMHKTVVKDNNVYVQGQINTVRHLVKVEEE
ncbi:MAG: 50S ribosomal protein L30 [Erysipelotrichaceae bacterium]|nr:50S ribosomal protein L30 [Erysipelotrichaceae bacterium]